MSNLLPIEYPLMSTPVGWAQNTNNGGYNDLYSRAQTGGASLGPNGNDGHRMPPPWGRYQPPSVSDPEDEYSASHYGSFESRPSTNASQESFNRQYPPTQTQWQGTPPPPRPPFTPDQGQSQKSQRDRSVSNGNRPTPPQSPFPQGMQFPSRSHRSQSQEPSSNRSTSFQSSQDTSLGLTDSRFLHPSRSSYSLNGAQLAETNRRISPPPAKKPVPQVDPAAWTCDVCMTGVSAKQPRFHCTVCHDYDQCLNCHQKEATSEGHLRSHKIISISMRHEISFHDLVAAHNNVTPDFSPPRLLPNWTVDENTDRRWLHVRNSPSHARFIAQSVPKGAYLVQLVFKFKLSEHVKPDAFKELKHVGLGQLRIALGSPLRTSVFLNQTKTEDRTLGKQLFGSDFGGDFKLTIPADVKDPKESWEGTYDLSHAPVYIGMNARVNTTSAVFGVVLQWSEVQEFDGNENPVLLMTLDEIK